MKKHISVVSCATLLLFCQGPFVFHQLVIMWEWHHWCCGSKGRTALIFPTGRPLYGRHCSHTTHNTPQQIDCGDCQVRLVCITGLYGFAVKSSQHLSWCRPHKFELMFRVIKTEMMSPLCLKNILLRISFPIHITLVFGSNLDQNKSQKSRHSDGLTVCHSDSLYIIS